MDTQPKEIAHPLWFLLLGLPCLDVITEIGLASAFPQLLTLYGSLFRASVVISMGPLLSVGGGWFWERVALGRNLDRVFRWATIGWAASVALLAVAIDLFAVALLLRGVQGFFSAGFAALPFISAMRASGRREVGARVFGWIEASVSVGAILAPVSVGLAFSCAPQLSLLGLVVPALILLATTYFSDGMPTSESSVMDSTVAPLPYLDTSRDDLPHSIGLGRYEGAAHRLIFVPAPFAALIATQLGAVETLIPLLGEKWHGSVLVSKVMTKLPPRSRHPLHARNDCRLSCRGMSVMRPQLYYKIDSVTGSRRLAGREHGTAPKDRCERSNDDRSFRSLYPREAVTSVSVPCILSGVVFER